MSAPQPPPQQGTQQGQQTRENPNVIQNFEDFMSQFGKIYSSAAEQSFRQNIFTQNLNIINVGLKYSVTNQTVHCMLLYEIFIFWVLFIPVISTSNFETSLFRPKVYSKFFDIVTGTR